MQTRPTRGRPARWSGRLGLVWSLVTLVMGLMSGTAEAQRPAPPESGCVQCHRTLTDARLSAPVARLEEDIHRSQGFSCVDCHGGDPAAVDKGDAKAPGTSYRGAARGVAQVALCSRCHSDAEFMRRYAPQQRVDQAAEYATSVHGRQLAAGREGVATCTSCHGVHAIRATGDAQSPVFPTNVAATCGACHADPARMGDVPTDQVASYQTSVHFDALTKGNDLSAPTCNDCHGNHGAAPPGVEDIAHVCATCHAVFGARFAESVHSYIFSCAECHQNHAIGSSRDEMLGTTEGAVCITCHAEGDTGFEVAARLRGGIDDLKRAVEAAETLTASIHNVGMEVGDQELALAEARTRLTLARTEMHTTDLSVVEPVLEEGHELVRRVEAAGAAQLEELQFRRVGLGISLAMILIVVVALWLKIQQLDRRHRVGHHAPDVEGIPNGE